jgi:phytoene dehydrogenase-like protein
MAVADWMRDALETERLRAAVAQPALLGSWMGPWSAGSAANLLLRLCPDDGEVEGGPPAIVSALTRAADALRVQVRTRAPGERLRVRAGRVEAAVLPGGDEVAAGLVVSALDPRRTLLDLVGAAWLPSALARDLLHWRCRGVTSAVRLALSAPLTTPAGVPVESLRLGASLDALERSFDAAKHGSPFAEPPALVARQPTLTEPGLSPSPGEHVVTVLVHGTPYDVKTEGGWSDPLREALGDAVVAALARHCPDLEASVVGRQVLTPDDLSRRYGLTGGHLFHGEHAPDQLLFLRPHPSLAHHGTPVAGLWLCGAGAHPGGGITGAAALLAVDAITRGGRE